MLDIFNDAIVNSTALYDYKARSPASMAGWFKAKEAGRYPVIGALGERGDLLGFWQLLLETPAAPNDG